MSEPKISLNQQIEEIERELKMRRSVYPRWVSAGKLRRGEAEYQIARMEAAKATLEWMRDNETAIRAAVRPSS